MGSNSPRSSRKHRHSVQNRKKARDSTSPNLEKTPISCVVGEIETLKDDKPYILKRLIVCKSKDTFAGSATVCGETRISGPKNQGRTTVLNFGVGEFEAQFNLSCDPQVEAPERK